MSIVIDKETLAAAETQLIETQQSVDYDVKEFTVGYLVQQFIQKDIYIPVYQREFVWDKKRQSKFIESVLLGLPIPYLFAAEVDGEHEGRLEIIDGAQRIQSLVEFHTNALELQDLEKLDLLNGFKYQDLPPTQRRRFDNRSIRMIAVSIKTASDVRFEIFERLNTGSVVANPAEVRKGAFAGPLQHLVEELSELELFKALCPISESNRKRGEARELVLRFFAYAERYLLFRHSVKGFLDDYMHDKKTSFNGEAMRTVFLRMLKFVETHFTHGFAKGDTSKSTPRVRFEAIAVGVHLALEQRPNLKNPSMDWLDSEEFKRLTTSDASNSGPKLRARIEFVRDSLLGKR